MTATALNATYTLLLAGDKMARDELVIQGCKIARFAVGRFIKRNFDADYLRDDMVAAANLAIIQAVDSIAANRTPVENVAAHLRTCATTACRDFLDGSEPIGPRARQRQRDRAAALPDRSAHVCTFNDEFHNRPESDKCRLMSDILETCKSADEHNVITLRASELSDEEIASRLGDKSRATVQRIRKSVEHRYFTGSDALAT